jgi:hypothetical protein
MVPAQDEQPLYFFSPGLTQRADHVYGLFLLKKWIDELKAEDELKD